MNMRLVFATCCFALHVGCASSGTPSQDGVGKDAGAGGRSPDAAASTGGSGGQATAAAVSPQIIVDQFGWRARAPRKVALFADPQMGQNAQDHLVPGSSFEVRRADDDRVVFTGTLVPWQDGAVDKQSGDRVWLADFSSFDEPGRYVIYDPQNRKRSFPFDVRDDVYKRVLDAATRSFYYQRFATDIDAAHGGSWTRKASHLQDKTAQLLVGETAMGQPRDVSGGWWDAGDSNKYVAYLSAAVWELMMAFELHPEAFGDDTNIPESGNGVPDLADEVKWELDWLLKMQFADGGVSNRVGGKMYASATDDPADDNQPRFYTPATTWSTATFAALTAHAARAYEPYEDKFPGFGAKLLSASEKAWSYLEANPMMKPADGLDGAKLAATEGGSRIDVDGVSMPDPKADRRARLFAAAELFATTGKTTYKTFFEAGYKDTSLDDGGIHPFKSMFLNPDRCRELARGMIVYAKAEGATASVVQEIKTLAATFTDWMSISNYTGKGNGSPPYANGDDPYRAFFWDGMYSWGSNGMKGAWGGMPLVTLHLEAAPGKAALLEEIAEEYVHYFHGRNPLSLVYLSNMGERGAKLGASRSVMEFYHYWFRDGSPLYDGPTSKYGPAPGFLVGGPNQYFAWNDFLKTIRPPHGEPPAKAFREWNTGWNAEASMNEDSWAITENGIYYQSAYVFLLSAFAR